MSFPEYIEKMKELGWKEEELKEDYQLNKDAEDQGISLPWNLFLKAPFR